MGWFAGAAHLPRLTRGPLSPIWGDRGNVAIRLPRACGALRRTMANFDCIVRPHIILAPWGHVAETPRPVSLPVRDLHFLKADRAAAYKQLPTDWGRIPLDAIIFGQVAIVASADPGEAPWAPDLYRLFYSIMYFAESLPT